MKKLRIIYALLFSMALFLAIPLNAAADFGPKPSVSISFRNAGGQTCYSAILARGSFQPSLGELVTEDAYSTEWFGELTPQEQEAVRAFADYAGRSAPDGYALFNRLWDVSRENVEMTYLPPDDFIVLAYFPDSGSVIASDICRPMCSTAISPPTSHAPTVCCTSSSPIMSEYGCWNSRRGCSSLLRWSLSWL